MINTIGRYIFYSSDVLSNEQTLLKATNKDGLLLPETIEKMRNDMHKSKQQREEPEKESPFVKWIK